jgi:hypothetical protein
MPPLAGAHLPRDCHPPEGSQVVQQARAQRRHLFGK